MSDEGWADDSGSSDDDSVIEEKRQKRENKIIKYEEIMKDKTELE